MKKPNSGFPISSATGPMHRSPCTLSSPPTAARRLLARPPLRRLLLPPTSHVPLGPCRPNPATSMLGLLADYGSNCGFFFFIFKKIKISKIYVRFEKFQKYTPVALWGATWLKYNFFFFKFATKSLEKKKGACRPPPQRRQDPVAHPRGDRALSPVGGRQGPLLKPWPSFPLSFEPKNSGKKRGVMKHRSINIPSIVCNGKYESDQ